MQQQVDPGTRRLEFPGLGLVLVLVAFCAAAFVSPQQEDREGAGQEPPIPTPADQDPPAGKDPPEETPEPEGEAAGQGGGDEGDSDTPSPEETPAGTPPGGTPQEGTEKTTDPDPAGEAGSSNPDGDPAAATGDEPPASTDKPLEGAGVEAGEVDPGSTAPVETDRAAPAVPVPVDPAAATPRTTPGTTPGTTLPTTPISLEPFLPSYRSLDEVETLLHEWVTAAGGLAQRISLDTGGGHDSPPAIQVVRSSGTVAAATRPTILLLGGLDGVSLAGCEAVLSVVHGLLENAETIPEDVAFVAVPWASPQALSLTLSSGISDGRNLRESDEDHDGTADEDGPDDLDGDGFVLHMLIEDPEGEWVRSGDPRFLARARPGDAPRYRLTREGRDDDRDGLFNEDGPGGVVLDWNFPSAEPRKSGGLAGPWAMSEGGARLLADFARTRNLAAVICFQGDHGGVGVPYPVAQARNRGSGASEDLPPYELVRDLFHEATDRPRPVGLRAHTGERARGSAVDYFYTVLGALGLEVAMWGPGRIPNTVSAGFGHGPRAVQGGSSLLEENPEWTRWLDDTQGGFSFRDWYPVELGGGLRGLIGGWEPFTRCNPPVDSLAGSLGGAARFVIELGSRLPRLSVRVEEQSRSGHIVKLSARVRNLGDLPTGLHPTDRWRSPEAPCGAKLEVRLPAGAELLAGEETTCFGRLAGQLSSRVVEWILILPPGEELELVATAPWASPVVLEVAP